MKLRFACVAAMLAACGGASAESCPKDGGIAAGFLELDAPIDRWVDAIPLGNGQAGALVWGADDELRFTLDRADYWHRHRNPMLDDPRFKWANLPNYTNDFERLKRVFVVRDDPSKLPGVRLVAKLAKLGGYPDAQTDISDKGAFIRRRNRTGVTDRWINDFVAGVKFRPGDARPDSAFWPAFWKVSAVTVPDRTVQRFYDFAMYCYGAASRPPYAPIALQAAERHYREIAASFRLRSSPRGVGFRVRRTGLIVSF